jgi:cell division protease FtsH
MAGGQKMPQLRPRFSFMWFWAMVIMVIVGYSLFDTSEQRPIEGDWNMVDELIEKGYVERIEVLDKEKASIYLRREAIDSLAGDERFANMPSTGKQIVYNTGGDVQYFAERVARGEERADAAGIDKKDVVVKYGRTERGIMDYIVDFLPWILIIAVWFFIMRSMARGGGAGGGGGIMNVGKARAQMSDKNNKQRVTFKDVAGLEEAKVEIMEIVDFLRNADKYKALGAKIPKGALLAGPPGTGKTLLAKAVAGEANVPFLSISGSDFVEMFVGVGASRVRDLFDQAKKVAPCIVFIDEIDAIGRARGKNSGFSGNDERENTLNQLLTEMDGFQTNTGVIVLAATNRVDILDKALMRAGRFDRQIEVGLPDVKERQAIFEVHLRNIKLDSKLDREFLAKQTPGFAGADIANVCNEAALIAARNNKDAVTQEDFLAAIDRIVGGLERRNMPMTKEERRSTAIHEAGHATVMWRLKNCDPVLKITIIPRGRSLGATWYLPEERVNHNVEHFHHKMAGMLGGRIAEQLLMGVTSTGALNDLERTTKIAYAMVAYYGMSPEVGNISFFDGTGQRDMFTKPFSEKTAELIDTEVRRLVDEAVELTRSIISEERENIERLADLLIEKETIFSEDVEAILGKSEQQKAKELLEAELKQTEVESAEEVEENESDVEVEVVVGDGDQTTTIKYVFDTESSETKEEHE